MSGPPDGFNSASFLTAPEDYWSFARLMDLGFTRGWLDTHVLKALLPWTNSNEILARWPDAVVEQSACLIHQPTIASREAAIRLGYSDGLIDGLKRLGTARRNHSEGTCPSCLCRTPVLLEGFLICSSCTHVFTFKEPK